MYMTAEGLVLCKVATEGGVPSAIQLIPYGVSPTDIATFVLDELSAPEIVAKANADPTDKVIDYEHHTETATEGGYKAPAAGWIKRIEDRGVEGIWGIVEWTEEAMADLKARKYRYFSPVITYVRDTGRITGFLRGALVNAPRIRGMVPVMNKSFNTPKEAGEMKNLLALLGLKPDADETAACKAVEGLKAVAARAAEGLGLKAGAGEAEITQGIAALKTSTAKDADVQRVALCKAFGIPEGSGWGEVTAYASGLKAQGDVAGQVGVLKEQLAALKADMAVGEAMQGGKITPALKDWAIGFATRDHDGFTAWCKDAPVVIHTGEQGGGGTPAPSVGADSPEAVGVCKQLGISPKRLAEAEGGDA